MKFFYLSSLLSIVTYVSAISECPKGGANAGVYGPTSAICITVCKNNGRSGGADNCEWEAFNISL
ncbi:hypothetical protein BJ944DRAFT_253380 [Cunninghamella echinulata]|nr:hypothetical protein BJ944DRAFT_253380 [Cunninghamella echinulata]